MTRMGCSSRVLVGIYPGFVEAVPGEPISRSLEPVISTAQALSEAGGDVIGDHLGDRHIHHPRRRACHGTGMTDILDACGPDPPMPL